jgi:hypothetical protein
LKRVSATEKSSSSPSPHSRQNQVGKKQTLFGEKKKGSLQSAQQQQTRREEEEQVVKEMALTSRVENNSFSSSSSSSSWWLNSLDNVSSNSLNESIFNGTTSAGGGDVDPAFVRFRDESRFWVQRVRKSFIFPLFRSVETSHCHCHHPHAQFALFFFFL